MKSKINIPDIRIELTDKTYCSNCNKEIDEGYVIYSDWTYYCSKKCLHNVISKEEYKELYSQELALWTTFED